MTDEPQDEEKTVSLVLTCVGAESCSVIFEPFGSEYVLQRDEDFHVLIKGPGSGEVLVWYGDGALSVTPWPGGDYASVITGSGKKLEV